MSASRRIVRPPAAGEPSPRWSEDGSTLSLVLANAFALVVALLDGWSLGSLMQIYWAQSVIIGISNVMRILALDRFSTENFEMNGQPVDPTPETKRNVAVFFALHYGFFHVAYLVFLFKDTHGPLGVGFLACVVAFAVNHVWSYRYNRDLDRQGTPNIGTLMFTPYARVVPMHIMIIVGVTITSSVAGLALFGVLKTVADVVMHMVEHAQLKRVHEARPPVS
jgi:hypothetical protein